MNPFFRNLFSETECKKIILNIRFPERVLCPKCSYHKIYELRHKLHFYKCKKCLSIFNEKTGTLFENSRISLNKWFCAFYLLHFNKNFTSVRLAKILGITQSSAWYILEKIKKEKDRKLINEIKKYVKAIESQKAKPFVLWSGSKRLVLQELFCRLPKSFNNYFEPFLGGGSLFFALANELKVEKCFYISDINKELITSYEVVKNNATELAQYLEDHKQSYSEQYYYHVRDNLICENDIDVASRFLFLNKTCFNGLYKTNNKGEFTGSFGHKQASVILDEGNFLAGSRLLKNENVNISNGTYHNIENNVKEGDFVYFDPPYFHYHNRDSYVDYVGGKKFNQKDEQIKLRDFIFSLHDKGVKIMFSNSNTEFICDLFAHKDFNIDVIKVKRNISHVGRNRGFEEEIIVRNYK
jgi:DNA adenine methylase